MQRHDHCAAHDDQADTASGAHDVLAGGEYGRISRDDYRPIKGGAAAVP